jgi:excinuclease UvrABC nuclease subunit
LEKAVKEEQFEEAATLRDKIRNLEAETETAKPAPEAPVVNRIASLPLTEEAVVNPKPRKKP